MLSGINKKIKMNRQTISYTRWYKQNVFYIKDLIKKSGEMFKFLTVDEFEGKYG